MSENMLSTVNITDNLETAFIGQRVLYYPQLTSTMDVARREALHGTAEGTVIIANEQTAGKGRVKRIWLSPKGNIALSVILYPALSYLPRLVMLASLAVVQSIEVVTGLKPQIKWPNDILINGKKVSGILIENDVKRDVVDFSILGIGMNVDLMIASSPDILSAATSLIDELGRKVSQLELVRCLLVEIEKLYLVLSDGESIYEEWRGRLVTLGRRVQIMSGKNPLTGIAESVGRDGNLLLRHSDGSSTEIIAGDVTLREHQ
ncbi:biotin--[acetyl-CoA-carboxylase] ligase [Chloroflexota bacterium]